MIDPRRIAPAYAPQIELSENEATRLAVQIREDFDSAKADHEQRMRRFTRLYRLFRGRPETEGITEAESSPDYRVPILQWQTLSKVAKEISALFGQDAEVIAQGTGPSDQANEKKLGLFMTWLLFSAMAITRKAVIWNTWKVIFGRAIAYTPWVRDTFDVPLIDGTREEEVSYEGPGFDPLWPDHLIVPACDANSIQEFPFAVRRYWVTPDELARGEGSLYNETVTERWEDILNWATQSNTREDQPIQLEKDMAEGVQHDNAQSAAGTVEVWEWYGRWRMLSSKQDGRRDNWKRRQKLETELVVRYLPGLHCVIGCQDLVQMYPRIKERRPFSETALVQDGSYWCLGFGELLERAEAELTRNHDLGSRAAAFAVGPMIFYRPESGFDPETFAYEPNTCIATPQPEAIKVVQMTADLQGMVLKEQQILSHMERVTGISDMNMGRAIDRPNAPKTARQTVALLEEGDLRASLELTCLREDWQQVLKRFWGLYTMYGPEQTFFRVTEEQANGLFDVKHGGAYMQQAELAGGYDFTLKFATSAHSREQRKQDRLALYQIDLGNPLVMQNPRALWHCLNEVHRALGDQQFSKLIPMPPDPGLEKTPEEEWTAVLQGEEIVVHPMDSDELHLLKHRRQIEDCRADNRAEDAEAIERLLEHISAHIVQLQNKRLMAAMATQMAQTMGHMIQGQLPQPSVTDYMKPQQPAGAPTEAQAA